MADRDGDLGVGGSIRVSLSPGTHVVTLTSTDSAGHTASDSVTVQVSAATGQPRSGRPPSSGACRTPS